MMLRLGFTALLVAALCGCAAPGPLAPEALPNPRPLDILPGGSSLALVRQDLLATAADRFGSEALDEAVAAPTYLVAKRFAGMAPPPPPDAGPGWRPPTPAALLVRRRDGWSVATPTGWRPADPEAAAELDQVLADPRFWSEPASIPPCPDYGASLLLLKAQGRAETVRNSACTSVSEKAVFAALRA